MRNPSAGRTYSGGWSRFSRSAAGYGQPYPADVDDNLHVLGALLILALGNIGLALAGLAPRTTTLGRLRVLAGTAGTVAAAGSILFFAQQSMGLGDDEICHALDVFGWPYHQ